MKWSLINKWYLLNPIKWFSVALGFVVRILIPTHILEQLAWRLVLCYPCYEKGYCTHCGCSFPDKGYVFFEKCSEGKWGPFKNKENWKAQKETFKFELKAYINGQERGVLR